MTGYLPRDIALGDRVMGGSVAYIHPKRRYAMVRFPRSGGDGTGHRVDKSIRECWPIMPDEDRLAHKPPVPEPNPKPPRPIAEMLQERDWDGMTMSEIAEELGVTHGGVCSAIHSLRRKGIYIKFRKQEAGWPNKARERGLEARRNGGAR
ncbi:MAG: TetR family transcriptional regulator [Clostridiales bacterium]|nr:TetR family transcriptional regulator [Clostridiales bacterium]